MAQHRYTRKFGGGYDHNPYYSPEGCGLEIVGTAEHEPDYDFSIILVVKDKRTGKLFISHDSGCSCPTPFEDHRSLADFDLLTDTEQIDRLADECYDINEDELLTLKRKVHAKLTESDRVMSG